MKDSFFFGKKPEKKVAKPAENRYDKCWGAIVRLTCDYYF